MITGYVRQEVRRSVRNILRLNFVLMLLVLVVPACSFPYIRECIYGPFSSTTGEIARIKSWWNAPHWFVRVTIDPSQLETWYYHASGGEHSLNDFYYRVRLPDKRVLIIKSDSAVPTGEVVGGVTSLDEILLNELSPTDRKEILPVMIDTAPYRQPMWIGLIVCTALLAIFGCYGLRFTINSWKPTKSLALGQLAKIGPVEEIALAIDAEMQEGSTHMGPLLVTRSWIIRRARFGTDFFYMGELAWAYMHNPADCRDGISVSKEGGFAIVLFDLNGSRSIFALSQDEAKRLVEDIARRVPWCVIGFAPEWLDGWRRLGPRCFEAVKERKADILRKNPALK